MPEEMRPYFSGCEYKNYQPNFLDSCFLCNKSLSQKSGIFMYRPFCSLECQQEQIEMDESLEKRRRVSSCSSKRSNRQTSESPNQSKTQKATI